MADELGRYAVPLVELLLERQDDEHPNDDALDLVHPAFTPGPHLRADVIHYRNADGFEAPRQPQVEVGQVEQDGELRPALLRLLHEIAHDPQDARDGED